MKIILETISVCLVILAAGTIALSQSPTQKSPRRKTSVTTSRSICLRGEVPEGFIIAGYKSSENCSTKLELVVRRPADAQVVCADSPIPAGFRIVGLQGSSACATPDSNPLTNAVLIEKDGLINSTPLPRSSHNASAPALGYQDEDEESPRQKRDGKAELRVERNSAAELAASPLPSRETIELAVRRSTVITGMAMQDVSRAWGRSHTTDSLVEDSALVHIWGYRRGRVYFRNGVVYRIILLKG